MEYSKRKKKNILQIYISIYIIKFPKIFFYLFGRKYSEIDSSDLATRFDTHDAHSVSERVPFIVC